MITLIDDPYLEVTPEMEEKCRKFLEEYKPPKSITIIVHSVKFHQEPWYGNPDGTIKEVDYEEARNWARGFIAREWQRYFQNALARMEEWT